MILQLSKVDGMLIIIKIFILISLIKIALHTDKPLMCAGIYTAIGMFFALLLGQGLLYLAIAGAIGFFLAALYFWLLTRTQESFVFWIVTVGGILIGLV